MDANPYQLEAALRIIVDIGILPHLPPWTYVLVCLSSWQAAVCTHSVISDAHASHFMSADSKLMFVKCFSATSSAQHVTASWLSKFAQ